MRQDLQVSGARLRRAFITGAFGDRDEITLRWAIPALRPERFPTLHSLCALTIYELARGLRVTLGAEADGYARELNRWAENPARPLPSAAGWILYTDACGSLPAAALEQRPGDPRRKDRDGCCYLDVDGLCYAVPTTDRLRLQAPSVSRQPRPPKLLEAVPCPSRSIKEYQHVRPND